MSIVARRYSRPRRHQSFLLKSSTKHYDNNSYKYQVGLFRYLPIPYKALTTRARAQLRAKYRSFARSTLLGPMLKPAIALILLASSEVLVPGYCNTLAVIVIRVISKARIEAVLERVGEGSRDILPSKIGEAERFEEGGVVYGSREHGGGRGWAREGEE
jgi:hypothetical protein